MTDKADLYQEAMKFAKEKASISYVQRKCRCSYNDAERMLEQMVSEGVISIYGGRKSDEAVGAGGVQALSAAPAVPHMSAAEVNNLPARARAYIHQLASLCDPAGLVRENALLLDTNNALQKMYRRAADACAEVFGCFAAAEIEGLKDALSDTTDERLKDLVERRLMYAMHAVRDIAASPTPPAEQPEDEGISREQWIDQAVRVYLIAGDTEDQALECAAYLWGELDMDDLADPYDAAMSDIEGRGPVPQAAPKAAPGEPRWWRKRADEIEAQVALTGSPEAMRCYTDMRTLLQAAAEAAPQQETQEPCKTCVALARTVMLDQISSDRKPDAYGIRQITDEEGIEEWEDIRTSQDVAREEANDMMATGRGELYEVVPLWTTPHPAPAPLSEPLEQLERGLANIGVVGKIDGHDVVRRESVLEIARRAALAAQGGKA